MEELNRLNGKESASNTRKTLPPIMAETINQNPEQKARDKMPAEAGWAVQSKNKVDFSANGLNLRNL